MVWLPIGSPRPAHIALKEAVWKAKLLKDVSVLADFIETGCLEVFHVQKNQYYSYNGIKSRRQLAIIDHNCNVGRGVVTTMSGEQRSNASIQSYRSSRSSRPYMKKSRSSLSKIFCTTQFH